MREQLKAKFEEDKNGRRLPARLVSILVKYLVDDVELEEMDNVNLTSSAEMLTILGEAWVKVIRDPPCYDIFALC